MSAISKPLYKTGTVPNTRPSTFDNVFPHKQQKELTYRGNPLNPTYKLPSYETIDPVPTKQLYETNKLDDIDGAQQRPSYYSTALKKTPQIRNTNLDVTDITGAPVSREKLPRPNLQDISDIASIKVQRSSSRDPVNPNYTWKNAENPDFLIDQRKEQLQNRQMKDSYIYNTTDIVGYEIGVKKRLRHHGHVGEVYDSLRTDDYQQKYKQELKRDYDFNSNKPLLQIGQENDSTAYQPSKNTNNLALSSAAEEQTYDCFKSMKESQVLKQATDFKFSGAYDIPEKKELPAHEIYKKKINKSDDPKLIPVAGINTDGLVIAFKHQTIGYLPGPPPETYKERGFGKVYNEEAEVKAIIAKNEAENKEPKKKQIVVSGMENIKTSGLLDTHGSQKFKESLVVSRNVNEAKPITKTNQSREKFTANDEIEMVKSLKF
ncbi:Conserved_hypothetical protein [Hexamita inflata]|uniref:Uncharacterized protein n=1 Tax=Hexamita inflata TaxID=28002 RepID=A0ABP1H4A2_9EUKA